MTNKQEIAVPEGTTSETSPVAATMPQGFDMLHQQVRALADAHEYASAVCRTQLVPKAYHGKPDDAAVAILYGAEIGMMPMQALQEVFVVNGKPAIYARTMAALLKRHGYRFETVEDTPQRVTITGYSPRGEQETSTWSIERATTAGYVRNTLYKTNPQAMLYSKALAEVCRRLAPDVLQGLSHSVEDLKLEPVQMTATRQDQRGMDGVRAALAAHGKTSQPEPEQEPAQEQGVSEVMQTFTTRALNAKSIDALNETAAEAQPQLTPEEWEELRQVLNTRYAELQGDEK